MNKLIFLFLAGFFSLQVAIGQNISFTEYDLDNGLHVILHRDDKAPVIAVNVYYHVGSKNEDTARTGFAHFFEHLLFEGSDNIKRGEFSRYVTSNGGQDNATTNADRTLYYEEFPSNQLKLALWLESERMMHPVINDVGVKTQNEVVKEERRERYDNRPYGQLQQAVYKRLFKNHPYRWPTIGSMAHLDAASLAEFQAFFKKYYTPNNAVLSIAGDINIDSTKKLVSAYFKDIPAGPAIVQPDIREAPITLMMVDTVYDSNIQIPAVVAAYRTPAVTDKDSRALNMLTSYLSGGASSKLYKKMVDDKKNALQVAAFNDAREDYGVYMTFALPNNNTPLNDLLADIDEEIGKVQTTLISESDYQKLLNNVENDFVSENSRMLNVAGNLAEDYVLFKNTGRINNVLKEYRAVTRQDIMDVAKKYLQKNQRLVLYYLPESAKK